MSLARSLTAATPKLPAPGLTPSHSPLQCSRLITPELSRNASEYLAKQRALVELQVKHFDEERCLSIAAAKRKRYADRIRNALATIVAIFAAGALVGIAVMIFDATHDHGLVVEAFSVPPDFADRGLTGRILASELLEQIDELQSRAQSGRALTTFKNDWGDDIRVAIPETGVSIGEVSRILHDRLGHVTRVQGSVVHTSGAVSVAAQVAGHPSVRASGPEADLEGLMHQVALGIFAKTQPYRYAVLRASVAQRNR